MLVSVQDVKVRKHTDSQREKTYSLDSLIKRKIKEKGSVFPKLFRHLDTFDMEQVSKHISEDFGLNMRKLQVSTSYIGSSHTVSYAEGGDIFIHNDHRHSLMVLLHEYAHIFTDFFFRSENGSSHDGYFNAAYRFLLNHYHILSYDEFNELANIAKVEVYVDAIVGFDFVTEDVFNSRHQELVENDKDVYLPYWVRCNGLERNIFNGKKTVHYFIKNPITGQFIVSSVNKCHFEHSHEFSEMTKEEMKNTVLLSPVFLMDESGEKVTGRDFGSPRGCYGYAIADGRNIDNGLCGFHSTSGFYSYGCEKEDKKDSAKELSNDVKYFKKSGLNVIKTTSEKEYRRLYSLMRERYYDIR